MYPTRHPLAPSPAWSITHGHDRVYLYWRGRLMAKITKTGARWFIQASMGILAGPIDGFASWRDAVDHVKEAFSS